HTTSPRPPLPSFPTRRSSDLSMDNMEVPAENRLGQEGEGFGIAMFALENGRYTVASGATGLIRACLDASVKYARERKTFGKAIRSEEHTSELQSRVDLVCRLL